MSASLRTTFSRIELLGAPFILLTAWSSVRPWICSSSIEVITSPDMMPAREAGVSSIGATTLTKPSSIVTSMPSPPNSPCVVSCISAQPFSFM
ncbi:hypothetical protein ACVWW1_001993 [Bradyrhizobium sp. JR3.5]